MYEVLEENYEKLLLAYWSNSGLEQQGGGQCTQEKHEDKLDFLILALWIAHL